MPYPVLEQLDSPLPRERIAALESLHARDDAALTARCAARLLGDDDGGVREAAVRVLVDLSTPAAAAHAAGHIASRDIAVRNLAGEVLAQMGAAAVEALAPAIDYPDKDVRKFAIDLLARLPAGHLAGRLAGRLRDDDLNVVVAAVEALGSLGAAEHGAVLRDLYDREPLARPSVATALGAFGGADNQTFLLAALGDENPVVQLAAAEALAAYDTPCVLEALLGTVETVDPMARAVVLASIVRLHEGHGHDEALPERLRPYLRQLLDDPDAAYQCAAVRGLRTLGADPEDDDRLLQAAGQDDDLDLEIFKTLAARPDALERVLHAAEAGTLAHATAAGFVVGLLARGGLDAPALAGAGRYLQAHFSALDADERVAAVNVAGRLEHPDLDPVVEAGLQDADPMVRTFAEEAARTFCIDGTRAPGAVPHGHAPSL